MRSSRTRFVIPELPREGETVLLPPEEAAHARARRLRPGDGVLLCDGSGREAAGCVRRIARGKVEVAIEEVRHAGADEADIAVSVAAVRLERLSWIAEKAAELGASRLAIVATARTQSYRASASALARLERLARAAAKQSGSARWPRLSGSSTLDDVLERETAPHRFLLDAAGDPFPGKLARGAVSILVGPEGGWTEEEQRSARERGWAVVALPAGKLRAETAAVAAIVLARAALARD